LILGADGLEKIVEAADANAEEKAVDLVWSGSMAAEAETLFSLLNKINNKNAKNEYYLTTIVAIVRKICKKCGVVEMPVDEFAGVNSRADLAAAEALIQKKLRAAAMANGVTLIDPDSVYLSADTRLGQDVIIEPNVVFGPGVSVDNNVHIKAFSHIEGAAIQSGAIIGPFARLRPGSTVGMGAHVGNFVELKNVRLGAGAKANHLTYLGDAEIGENTNIGAGTITCNYDGHAKHKTIIGANSFIGSDAVLVAPVTLADSSFVAAGSVITEDVSEDELAIARTKQVNKPGKGARTRTRLRNSQ
jgi:bifunctional UDP-N-acetylglucosamine pyrophosphorylase/glucosamine-1-phosphate N-acetyltransferase